MRTVRGCGGPTREEAEPEAEVIFTELLETLRVKYGIERPDGEYPRMVQSWEEETAQLKSLIIDMVYSKDIANF